MQISCLRGRQMKMMKMLMEGKQIWEQSMYKEGRKLWMVTRCMKMLFMIVMES